MKRSALVRILAGAALGPLGGSIVVSLVPEIEHTYRTSTTLAGLALAAYLVPFAAVQLVSGTVAERFGRNTVGRIGFLAYAAGCACSAVAPSIATFLVGRAAQGTAAAFVTPLLLASLVDITQGSARAVALFGAVQNAAAALGPLAGALFATINWHLAFAIPAVLALVLALPTTTSPARRPSDHRSAQSLVRALLTPRLVRLSVAALFGYGALMGSSVVVAIHVADRFDLPVVARGMLLASYGIAGFSVVAIIRQLVRRYALTRIAVASLIVGGVLIATIPLVPGPIAVTLAWAAAGVMGALFMATFNALSTQVVPENRAGAVSVVGAFRFMGQAGASALTVMLYQYEPAWAFGVVGVFAAIAVAFSWRVAPAFTTPASTAR